LFRLKESIWSFFEEEFIRKPVLYKSFACYAYIISNKCIYYQDIGKKAGINEKSAKKLLAFLENRGLLYLQHDGKDCPLKDKQAYFNPSALLLSRPLDLRWEEFFVLSALKMLPSFSNKGFDKLTSLQNISIPSPEKWIRSLMEKNMIQGDFSADRKTFYLHGYSYPVLLKHRFFSSYFPVIEGIENLYGPKVDLETLKRLLKLETSEVFGLLAELALVDYLTVKIDLKAGENLHLVFETKSDKKITAERLLHLDEDGIYYKILKELLIRGRRTISELATLFDVNMDEMERMILLLSSIAGKNSLFLYGSLEDPITEFQHIQKPMFDNLSVVNYETICCFLIFMNAKHDFIPLDAFPFLPERLMKVFVQYSLLFHSTIYSTDDWVNVNKIPELEEWKKGLFLTNVLKGFQKLNERRNNKPKSPLDIYKEEVMELFPQYSNKTALARTEESVKGDDSLLNDQAPLGWAAITRDLTEFDKVFIGVINLTRSFDPEKIAKLLFLEPRLVVTEFLSLYARDLFKVMIRKNGEIVTTDLVLSSSKNMNLSRDRLTVLENLFSSNTPLVINESDIFNKQYNMWDLGFFSYYGVIKGRLSLENKNLMIQQVLFDPLLTSITCFNCGVSVSVLDSFCDACGYKIVQCPVCKRYLVFGDKILMCTSCYAIFHDEHVKEYLKQHGNCPSCGQKSPEMTPFL
jgi:hypothetical protein